MKAAQINEYGEPSVINIVEVEKPTISDNQVLVQVHSSSINPFDAKLRAGVMKDFYPLQFPYTLGGDIAGVVTEVGSSVIGIAAGDKVFGQAGALAGNSGAYEEFAAVKADQLAISAKGLGFNDLAALPLVGVSAIQALTEHIGLKSGEKIFIHGGGGGIGSIAIQIAKNIGAYVATTATGDDIARVKELGADEVIDYKTEDFSDKLSDFDAVFDCVGGDDFTKSLQILKNGGRAVSMIAQADEAVAKEHDIKAITQGTKLTTENLNTLRELVESGVVKPNVGKVFEFDDIRQAFTEFEAGQISGKVVIEITRSK